MARLKRTKNTNIVINNQTRLFIKGRSGCCCPDYNYHSCIAIGDITKSKPERQKIYSPSPTTYNEFEVVQEIISKESSGSSSFSTNYTLGKSVLEELYNKGCLFDAQIHIGVCTDPSIFAQYEKIIVLQGIEVTNYNISNIFAKQSSEQGVVTESVDFNFESMYSYSIPKIGLNTTNILADGPIIDSFTTCDNTCCLCPNSSGTFLVQLVQCNTDCGCAEGCVKPRIIYKTTEKNEWRVFNLSFCDEIACTTPVNRNVMESEDGTTFNYVYLNGNYGNTIRTTLANSLVTIPANILQSNEKLISADGCGNTVILVGNTSIVLYNASNKTYKIVHHEQLPLVGIDYSDVSIHNDCDTVYIAGNDGRVIQYNIEEATAQTYYLNNGVGIIHHVEAISPCSFLAAIEDDLYYVCEGIARKSINILGTITSLYNVDGDIVYAATNFQGINMLWVSADGGQSFTNISEDDESGNVISNISACVSNPELVNFAGYFNASGVTENELQTSHIEWECETFDGILFDNK